MSPTPHARTSSRSRLVVELDLTAITDQQFLAEQAEQHRVLGAGELGVQLHAHPLEVLHRVATLVHERLADRVAMRLSPHMANPCERMG